MTNNIENTVAMGKARLAELMEGAKVRDCGDGWWEAEIQLSRFHPRQLGAGKDRETALANLAQRVHVWVH